MAFGSVFAPWATRIFGGLSLALALGLAVMSWRYGNVKEERDALQAWKDPVVEATRIAAGRPKLAESQVALQIAYLASDKQKLRAALTQKNQESLARAADFDRRLAQMRRDNERLDREARATDRQIDRLMGIANEDPGDRQCPVPGDLLRELEGL